MRIEDMKTARQSLAERLAVDPEFREIWERSRPQREAEIVALKKSRLFAKRGMALAVTAVILNVPNVTVCIMLAEHRVSLYVPVATCSLVAVCSLTSILYVLRSRHYLKRSYDRG